MGSSHTLAHQSSWHGFAAKACMHAALHQRCVIAAGLARATGHLRATSSAVTHGVEVERASQIFNILGKHSHTNADVYQCAVVHAFILYEYTLP